MIHKTWSIIIASGKSEQILSTGADVAFLGLGDKPVIAHSLQAMEECDEIDGVIVVVPKERMNKVLPLVQMFGFNKLRRIVAGTSARLSSLQAGMKELDDDVSIVVVHEVSRPFVRPQVISESVRVAKRYGCAVVANQINDAIKIVEKGSKVKQTQERRVAWAVQSPQSFRRELLEKAIENNKGSIVEESEMLEAIKEEVRVVPSSKLNIKIDSIDALSFAGVLERIELEQQQDA
jgi:2-C-methyl-D-erythritol 4-phosphate cytidylyltransferase